MTSLTTINVRGQAHDSRLPDHACVHLSVRIEGHEWHDVHTRTAQALAGLSNGLMELARAHPEGVARTSITQVTQSNWTVRRLQTFSEEAQASITFTDFALMGAWLADTVSGHVHVGWIEWQLSPAVRATLRASLGEAAVRDARERAEVFAAAAGLRIVGIAALADPGLLGVPNAHEPVRVFGTVHRAKAAALSLAEEGDGPAEPTGYDLEPETIETDGDVEATFLAE